MSQAFTTAGLQATFGYPFRDAKWKNKFLIGSLVTIAGFVVPLIPFIFLYGYMAQIMRRVIVDKAEPFLPEWQDWNKLLVDGFKLFGAIFVVMLPVVALFVAGYMLVALVPMFAGIPMAGMVEQGNDAAGTVFAILMTASVLVGMVLYGVGLLLSLALGVVLPAMLGHVVATDTFSAAFRWREWWAIFRANLGGFMMTYLVIMVLGILLNAVFMVMYCTIILCCLIPFVVGPLTMYLICIYGALFAQAYREGAEKLAAPGAQPLA